MSSSKYGSALKRKSQRYQRLNDLILPNLQVGISGNDFDRNHFNGIEMVGRIITLVIPKLKLGENEMVELTAGFSIWCKTAMRPS